VGEYLIPRTTPRRKPSLRDPSLRPPEFHPEFHPELRQWEITALTRPWPDIRARALEGNEMEERKDNYGKMLGMGKGSG